MILDKRLEFCDNVSVAAAAGTALVGDVIDLGGTTNYPGNGEPLYLVIQSGDTEIITGGSAGTIQFHLVSDSLATLGAGVVASCTLHYQTGTFVTDDTAANDAAMGPNATIAVVALPRGSYERYLGILVTIATTTVTAGTINAFLTQDPNAWVATADGVPANPVAD